jgi:hypothetical protein
MESFSLTFSLIFVIFTLPKYYNTNNEKYLPRHHHVWACTCNLSTQEAEAGGSPD